MCHLARFSFWGGVGLLAFNVASALVMEEIEVGTSILGAMGTVFGVCVRVVYVFSREDEYV